MYEWLASRRILETEEPKPTSKVATTPPARSDLFFFFPPLELQELASYMNSKQSYRVSTESTYLVTSGTHQSIHHAL